MTSDGSWHRIRKLRTFISFILANTEQLHAKIHQMRFRIQALEDALKTMQSRFSSEPHPLLDEDLLLIKTSTEFYRVPEPQLVVHTPPPLSDHPEMAGDSSETCGVPPTDDPEDSSNSRECPGPPGDGASPCDVIQATSSFHPLEVPDDLMKLSQSFPIACPTNGLVRDRIRGLLPPRPEAESLCKHAHLNALSQYVSSVISSFYVG